VGHVHHAEDVHFQDPRPVGGREVREWEAELPRPDCGRVDQVIDRAESRFRLSQCVRHGGEVGHVYAENEVRIGRGEVPDGDATTLGPEGGGGGPADAARPAGDDGDATGDEGWMARHAKAPLRLQAGDPADLDQRGVARRRHEASSFTGAATL
jgi:hypothetical protein